MPRQPPAPTVSLTSFVTPLISAYEGPPESPGHRDPPTSSSEIIFS